MMAEKRGKGAAIAALVYAALWAGATGYLFATGGDWITGLFVLGIFGFALMGLAWFTTRGADAPPIPVERPSLEAGAVLAYLAIYAIVFLGFGMTAARAKSLLLVVLHAMVDVLPNLDEFIRTWT